MPSLFDILTGRGALSKTPQEEPTGLMGLLSAVTSNPMMARQFKAQAEANPRPNLAEVIGYPKTWAEFGQNVVAQFPINSPEAVRNAAQQLAMSIGPQAISSGAKQAQVFYRGVNPGDSRRIQTGDEFWDSLLFASKSKESASMYGKQITEFKPLPDAKILEEGTAAFRSLGGGQKKGKNMLQWASDITKNAKEAGYDAVAFERQGDIGTAILNPSKFTNQVVP